MIFRQRTSAPTGGEKYWLRPEFGGINLCIKARDDGSTIPNCTGYAYGRFMEEANLYQCNLSRADAENWYGNADGYSRGKTPKLGAVMCWRNGQTGNPQDGHGHVAIVEQINPDGSVECSMSNWPIVVSGKTLPFWERKTYYPPFDTNTGLIFQGFIYNPALEVEALQDGMNVRKIDGTEISIYKVASWQSVGLLRAREINGLQGIREFDMAGINIYERSGNNYVQLKSNQSDPVGTVYGPRVCLDGHVDMPEDYEHFLYFMVRKDGSYEFGDWDGMWKNPTDIELMFSPGVIFYRDGKGQRKIKYAPTMASYTAAHWQCYYARTSDGAVLRGVTKGPLTPSQLWDYLSTNYDVTVLCFMDGGSVDAGSAQQTYWDGCKVVDYQNINRRVGDMMVTYTKREAEQAATQIEPLPVETEPTDTETNTAGTPPEEDPIDETEKDEETHMEENTSVNVPEFVPKTDWKDPEEGKTTFKDRFVAMLSIKSILTLSGNAVFLYLTVIGRIAPEVFMAVFSSEMAFYFGTTYQKNGGK